MRALQPRGPSGRAWLGSLKTRLWTALVPPSFFGSFLLSTEWGRVLLGRRYQGANRRVISRRPCFCSGKNNAHVQNTNCAFQ